MESLQRTPSKITNTYLKWHVSLYEIEAQIIQFTNLQIHAPALDLLADDIMKKFGFIRNFLIAETISCSSIPDDLKEIERKLLDLEAEFCLSNSHRLDVDHEDDGSVCESCLNSYSEFEGSDVSSGHEMLREYEVTVPQSPGEIRDSSISLPEKFEETSSSDCKREKTGKRRRRWWWRTVVILMPASVVILAVSYFDKKQHEGFLTPT